MKDFSQHYQFSAPRVPAASSVDSLQSGVPASDHVTIDYQLIDRAGNVSLLSHSVTLSMQL
ncbi:hypothetical protein [Pseudomonas savastanoi]|uniref:Uncharacterized protein n=1 Tax=Pseudomonas savastanoi TaxID=29438 RepID=A0AAW3LX89_PSESS|nr:hypothetical protein [Pseudomonas savastanoi]KTC58547.1 hypothetical protein AO287_10505 [Pseudomonas savastanoi]